MVAIVRFRDGKLAHEHIYWDQASVLKQIGLLTDPALPVFGAESARKARRRARGTAESSRIEDTLQFRAGISRAAC